VVIKVIEPRLTDTKVTEPKVTDTKVTEPKVTGLKVIEAKVSVRVVKSHKVNKDKDLVDKNVRMINILRVKLLTSFKRREEDLDKITGELQLLQPLKKVGMRQKLPRRARENQPMVGVMYQLSKQPAKFHQSKRAKLMLRMPLWYQSRKLH